MERIFAAVSNAGLEASEEAIRSVCAGLGIDPENVSEEEAAIVVNQLTTGGALSTKKTSGKPARKPRTAKTSEGIANAGQADTKTKSASHTERSRNGMITAAEAYAEDYSEALSDDLITILDTIPNRTATKLVVKSAERTVDPESFRQETYQLLSAIYPYSTSTDQG